MRLDRYTGEEKGKYSIIENRKGGKIVNIGDPIDDFFVIKLKDINSREALLTYAAAARANGDDELAIDVERLASKSGVYHPHCKHPD